MKDPAISRIHNLEVHRDIRIVAAAPKVTTVHSIGLADFNERAAIEHHIKHYHAVKSMHPRRMTHLQRRPAVRRQQNERHVVHHDDGSHLHAATADAVEMLHQNGRIFLERQITREYDPLERAILLRNARSQAEDNKFSPDEKEKLKAQLDGMLSDLMARHGDVIEPGLTTLSSFETALDIMTSLAAKSTGFDPWSIQDLRARFGAKGDGRREVPLTPLELAKSMLDLVGVDNFIGGLGRLRSRMAARLRTRPGKSGMPSLWLSLNDAACFSAVQSAFAVAGEFRSKLLHHYGITPKSTQAGTTIGLLSAPETSIGMIHKLVGQMVDAEKLSVLQNAQSHYLIARAIFSLPISLWDATRLPQRLELLDSLRARSIITDSLASGSKAEKQFEEQLRSLVSTGRIQNNSGAGDAQHRDNPPGTEDT